MASQSTGIQQLLSAEKRSAERIEDARKRKARRLKQAKEEALAEIEKYKIERERKYKDLEVKLLGSKSTTEQKIIDSADKRIAEVKVSVKSNQEVVIKLLLESVLDIHPQLHENYRPHLVM